MITDNNNNPQSPISPYKFDVDNFPLAYAYVPIQKLGKVFTEAEALSKGTLFPELYKPMSVYGMEFSGKIIGDVCLPKENMANENENENRFSPFNSWD